MRVMTFPISVDSFSEGRKPRFDRVTSDESESVPLNPLELNSVINRAPRLLNLFRAQLS